MRLQTDPRAYESPVEWRDTRRRQLQFWERCLDFFTLKVWTSPRTWLLYRPTAEYYRADFQEALDAEEEDIEFRCTLKSLEADYEVVEYQGVPRSPPMLPQGNPPAELSAFQQAPNSQISETASNMGDGNIYNSDNDKDRTMADSRITNCTRTMRNLR